MATGRRNAFSVEIDVTQLTGLANDLGKIAGEDLANAALRAVNAVAERAYDQALPRMTAGINLSEQYVRNRMELQRAGNPLHPVAKVVALGRYTTSLSQYGALQKVRPVNWSNARIAGMGKKFGKWPGWTRRTGSLARGIAEGDKAAGVSVEVTRGSRKSMGPVFTMPSVRDSSGNPMLFHHVNGNPKKIAPLYGPSVYQLFRVAAGEIEGAVADDLEASVVAEAERLFAKVS